MSILTKIYNPREIKSQNGREYYFDNLKFLLIFLVVLGHFAELIMNNKKNNLDDYIFISYAVIYICFRFFC